VVAAMERNDALGYTNAPGSMALRRRICRHYADAYGEQVSADDVVVVAGGSAFLSSPPQLVAMSRATAQQAVDRSVRLRGDRDMRPARLVR